MDGACYLAIYHHSVRWQTIDFPSSSVEKTMWRIVRNAPITWFTVHATPPSHRHWRIHYYYYS